MVRRVKALNRRKLSKRKKLFLLFLFFFLPALLILHQPIINLFRSTTAAAPVENLTFRTINATVEQGDTLFSIFVRHGLRIEELFAMKSAAAGIHPLRELRPGKAYSFVLDEQNSINSFTYGIDDDTVLKIEQVNNVFRAHKYDIPYERRIITIRGAIEDNLISAMGAGREDYLLALQAADILAWDIDFNTDLRKGDTFRIIVEGLYLEGEFKKYGRIFAVEFINNGQNYTAYLFEHEGKTDYYDAAGNSLRKAFLKAPLSFRRISSFYSKNRLHPVLRIYRPHHGIDYVAPAGTPVSATADGVVTFAGHKGDYGKLIIVSHSNGYRTYYGHLSRLAKGIHRGKKIKQGDLVGYVGATGLATGPHLHYEMRIGQSPVNPLRVKNIAGEPVPKAQKVEFKRMITALDNIFAAAIFYDARQEKSKKYCLHPQLFAEYQNLSIMEKSRN